MRILIVEDDVMVGHAATAALAAVGHSVIGPARDEHAAVQLATAQRPDLALVDYNLEDGGSGATVADLIRNLYGTPSMFVSGNPDLCRKAAKRVGALGCLAKPFSEKTLLEAVDLAEALINNWRPAVYPRNLELYSA